MKRLLVALISVAGVVFVSPFVAAREIPVLSAAQNQQDNSQMEFDGNSNTLVIKQQVSLLGVTISVGADGAGFVDGKTFTEEATNYILNREIQGDN
jgi:hypothetical protein